MNSLPNSAIKSTPFEELFNKKPSFRHLRIFDSRVFAYKPNKCKAKFDFNNEPARFLHFGGTDNNLVVRDERTVIKYYIIHLIFNFRLNKVISRLANYNYKASVYNS